MTKKTWVNVKDWESARKWIQGGKSKISRPLYDRYLSVRLIEPDNPDSDISLNYRYRHIVVDPHARKGRWVSPEYAEILDPEPDDSGWLGEYRKPILIYKRNGTVLLTGTHRFREYKVMSDYSGLLGVIRKSKVVKVRQPNDTLIVPKVKRKCRLCTGLKYFTYTCWQGVGPVDEDMQMLESIKDGWNFACSAYNTEEHNTHVHRMNCGRCAGTGYSKATFERWNSYVWEDDIDLLVDQSKQELIL
jgi:hypothetical protein